VNTKRHEKDIEVARKGIIKKIEAGEDRDIEKQ